MTKRVIINLPLLWTLLYFTPCVKAEIVDVAPHLANVASFAVHRNEFGYGWRVTNIETGAYIEIGTQLSRDGAIAAATTRLAAFTADQFAVRMARANRKWPRNCPSVKS
mgnify:CR=1 FL=1